jgi:hypothetical protein
LSAWDSWRRVARRKLSPTRIAVIASAVGRFARVRAATVARAAPMTIPSGGSHAGQERTRHVRRGRVCTGDVGVPSASAMLGCPQLHPKDPGTGRGGGASDLVVNAGTTRTIAVPIGAEGIAYVRSHGPSTFELVIDTSLRGTINTNDRFNHVSLNNDLTVAAPG